MNKSYKNPATAICFALIRGANIAHDIKNTLLSKKFNPL